MAVIEWIRFLAGAVCLLCGLGIFLVEMIGVFRFKYVLNRMHAAAMGDTLGIGFALAGLILTSGFTFTSVKLLLVIVFLWFASPPFRQNEEGPRYVCRGPSLLIHS